MTATEKNAHYGKLNDQFDARATVLRGLGFRYEHVPALQIAVFTKTRFGRVTCLPASFVMNADEIVWGDKLDEVTRFCA